MGNGLGGAMSYFKDIAIDELNKLHPEDVVLVTFEMRITDVIGQEDIS